MRAIDADDAIHQIDMGKDAYNTAFLLQTDSYTSGAFDAIDHDISVLKAAPTLDVMPVKRGRWITEGGDLICPVCGAAYNEEILWMYRDESDQDCGLSYCPHCAAKLER